MVLPSVAAAPTDSRHPRRRLPPLRVRARRCTGEAHEMAPNTRAMLDEFFAPYNALLAQQLGDDAYRWSSPPA